MGNGLVYESISPSHSSILSGSRITIFDVRTPAQPKPVGHFAVPNARLDPVSCSLPGDRALIGGDRLYLVGPPPRL